MEQTHSDVVKGMGPFKSKHLTSLSNPRLKNIRHHKPSDDFQSSTRNPISGVATSENSAMKNNDTSKSAIPITIFGNRDYLDAFKKKEITPQVVIPNHLPLTHPPSTIAVPDITLPMNGSIIVTDNNKTYSYSDHLTFNCEDRTLTLTKPQDLLISIKFGDIQNIDLCNKGGVNPIKHFYIVMKQSSTVSASCSGDSVKVSKVWVSIFLRHKGLLDKVLNILADNDITQAYYTLTDFMSLHRRISLSNFFKPLDSIKSISPDDFYPSSPVNITKPLRTTRSANSAFKVLYMTDDLNEAVPQEESEPEAVTPHENISYEDQIVFHPKLKYNFGGNKSMVVSNNDFKGLYNNNWINDTIVDFFLNYNLQKAKEAGTLKNYKIEVMNSFFYSRLTRDVSDDDYYSNVKSWFKNNDTLFDKDFVVVPINKDMHWFFVIITNLPKVKRSVMATAKKQKKEASAKHKEKGGAGASSLVSEPVEESKYTGSHEYQRLDNDETLREVHVSEHEEDREEIDEELNNDHKEGSNDDVNEDESQNDEEPTEIRSMQSGSVDVAEEEGKQNTPINVSQDENLINIVKKEKPKSVANIFILDSLRKPHVDLAVPLKSFLLAYAKDKYDVDIPSNQFFKHNCSIPQQKNFYDCGLHVIYNIKKFFAAPLEFKTKILTEKKRKRALVVMANKLFDDEERKSIRSNLREELLDLLRKQVEASGGEVSMIGKVTNHDHDSKEAELLKEGKHEDNNPDAEEVEDDDDILIIDEKTTYLNINQTNTAQSVNEDVEPPKTTDDPQLSKTDDSTSLSSTPVPDSSQVPISLATPEKPHLKNAKRPVAKRPPHYSSPKKETKRKVRTKKEDDDAVVPVKAERPTIGSPSPVVNADPPVGKVIDLQAEHTRTPVHSLSPLNEVRFTIADEKNDEGIFEIPDSSPKKEEVIPSDTALPRLSSEPISSVISKKESSGRLIDFLPNEQLLSQDSFTPSVKDKESASQESQESLHLVPSTPMTLHYSPIKFIDESSSAFQSADASPTKRKRAKPIKDENFRGSYHKLEGLIPLRTTRSASKVSLGAVSVESSSDMEMDAEPGKKASRYEYISFPDGDKDEQYSGFVSSDESVIMVPEPSKTVTERLSEDGSTKDLVVKIDEALRTSSDTESDNEATSVKAIKESPPGIEKRFSSRLAARSLHSPIRPQIIDLEVPLAPQVQCVSCNTVDPQMFSKQLNSKAKDICLSCKSNFNSHKVRCKEPSCLYIPTMSEWEAMSVSTKPANCLHCDGVVEIGSLENKSKNQHTGYEQKAHDNIVVLSDSESVSRSNYRPRAPIQRRNRRFKHDPLVADEEGIEMVGLTNDLKRKKRGFARKQQDSLESGDDEFDDGKRRKPNGTINDYGSPKLSNKINTAGAEASPISLTTDAPVNEHASSLKSHLIESPTKPKFNNSSLTFQESQESNPSSQVVPPESRKIAFSGGLSPSLGSTPGFSDSSDHQPKLNPKRANGINVYQALGTSLRTKPGNPATIPRAIISPRPISSSSQSPKALNSSPISNGVSNIINKKPSSIGLRKSEYGSLKASPRSSSDSIRKLSQKGKILSNGFNGNRPAIRSLSNGSSSVVVRQLKQISRITSQSGVTSNRIKRHVLGGENSRKEVDSPHYERIIEISDSEK